MAKELDLNERIVLNAIFAKIDKTAFSLSTGMVFFSHYVCDYNYFNS